MSASYKLANMHFKRSTVILLIDHVNLERTVCYCGSNTRFSTGMMPFEEGPPLVAPTPSMWESRQDQVDLVV